MTAREMFIGFMNQLYMINPAFEKDEVIDSTLAMYYINLAQHRYINEKYLNSTIIDNVTSLNKNIEDFKRLVSKVTLFRRDHAHLYPFIYDVAEIPINGPSYVVDTSFQENYQDIEITQDGGINIPVPSDYFYYLSSTSKVVIGNSRVDTIPPVNPTVLTNRLISYTEFNASNIVNINNSPIIRNPFVILERAYTPDFATGIDKMTIYADTYTTIYNVEITYIKSPDKISLGSYLDGNTATDCALSSNTHKDIVDMAVKIFIEENKYKLTNKVQ